MFLIQKIYSFRLILSFFALMGCVDATTPTDTPEITDIPKAASSTPYRLQVGDVVDIKVRLAPELNEQVVVPPDGRISSSLANDIPAAGRTVAELRKDLAQHYRKELKNPQISVIIKNFAPYRVYVAGEVNAAGEFASTGQNLSLTQAIARAGGLRNSADLENILIIHHETGKKPISYIADYAEATSGENPESDILLAANDVVFVPRTGIADVYVYFQQYVQQFLPSAFGLSYQLNPQNTVGR